MTLKTITRTALEVIAVLGAALGAALLVAALPVGLASGILLADALSVPSASVVGAPVMVAMIALGCTLIGKSLDLEDRLAS